MEMSLQRSACPWAERGQPVVPPGLGPTYGLKSMHEMLV